MPVIHVSSFRLRFLMMRCCAHFYSHTLNIQWVQNVLCIKTQTITIRFRSILLNMGDNFQHFSILLTSSSDSGPTFARFVSIATHVSFFFLCFLLDSEIQKLHKQNYTARDALFDQVSPMWSALNSSYLKTDAHNSPLVCVDTRFFVKTIFIAP